MRCKHDVHGTDCVICFPADKAQGCICGEINARHCPVHNEAQGVRAFYVSQEATSNRALIREHGEKWPDDINGEPSKDKWFLVIEHSAYQAAVERALAAEAALKHDVDKIEAAYHKDLTAEKLRSGKLVSIAKQIMGNQPATSDFMKLDQIRLLIEECEKGE